MFHTPQAFRELSLAVVGLDYPNKDRIGSSRRFEAALCGPGDPVTLRREPRNAFDPDAVAVFSERGVQLGYLTSQRCSWIGAKIAAGEPVVAVFQCLEGRAAVIRARIGGGTPTLPPAQPTRASAVDDFVADPAAPEWGA